MGVRVYFHPTCATSWRLIKGLHEEGYLKEVELVDLTKPVKLVWSVPWVEVDGVPAATDPVKVEEVLDILRGRVRPPKKGVTAFVRALIHSTFASSLAYLHDSLRVVLDDDFLKAATRYPFGGAPPEEVKESVLSQEEELLDRYREDLKYTLAVGYVRYLYWSGGEPDPKGATLWLLTSASVGRVGLPWKPLEAREKGEDLFKLVKENRELYDKVKAEQEAIAEDELYWRIVGGEV